MPTWKTRTTTFAPLVDAAQTPPFLTDRRVVVGREIGRFSTVDSLSPLLGYLENPLETTDLVLVWEKGPALQRLNAVPKRLTEAVAEAGGEVVGAGVPRGRDGAAKWMDTQVAAAGLRLRAGAKRLLADHLGEDMSRLPAVLTTLASAYGPDRALEADDVAPFIWEARIGASLGAHRCSGVGRHRRCTGQAAPHAPCRRPQ